MNKRRYQQVAIAGGVFGIMLAVGFALTGWGAPGTAAYVRYERLNRLMAVALLLMAGGWLGIWRLSRTRASRWGALLALIGTAGMAAGTAAEFWLYTDLSYQGSSMRQVAFTFFSFAALVFNIGATLYGISLWRSAAVPRQLAVLFLLALPLDIAAFLLLDVPFVTAALLSLGVALVLRWHWPAEEHQPVPELRL
jgi:hypothetical protein